MLDFCGEDRVSIPASEECINDTDKEYIAEILRKMEERMCSPYSGLIQFQNSHAK